VLTVNEALFATIKVKEDYEGSRSSEKFTHFTANDDERLMTMKKKTLIFLSILKKKVQDHQQQQLLILEP
jgi:hypothetical protein